MNPEILKVVGQVAGLGGIAVVVVVYLFREVIRKKIFPMLTREQAYQLLQLIIVLSASIAILGVIAWIYVTVQSSIILILTTVIVLLGLGLWSYFKMRVQKSPQDMIKAQAKTLFDVPKKDQILFKNFLQESGTDIFRMQASPEIGEASGIRGGGVYYSFIRRSHEYGFGSDIAYRDGQFRTGFAGADYGYFLLLDDKTIDIVAVAESEPPDWLSTEKREAWKYLWTYKPPRDIKKIRKEQKKARGLVIGNNTLTENVAALVNHTYLLRSILIRDSDILVVFRLHKILDDKSIVIVSRILKTFDTPIDTGSE